MPNHFFSGIIQNGKFVLDESFAFAQLKKSLEGQRIELTVQVQPDLPDAARKYYFKTIVERLASHTGHTILETHKGLKARFLTRFDDKGKTYVPSLTRLSPVDRAEYFDRCHAYLGEIGAPELDPLPEYQLRDL